MSWPPNATWSWVSPAAWAVSMTLVTAALGRSWLWVSKMTVAKATWPSWLTWPAPPALNGLVTERTWGRSATRWSMATALASAVLPRSGPEGVYSTIWSELPDAVGKSFSSRLRALADWVLGSWNLVEKSVPAAWVRANEPTKASSQKASTDRRWLKHQRAKIFTAPS